MLVMAPKRETTAGDTDQFDPAAVGKALKTARKDAGMSMDDLAKRSGVSQPFISQLERGLFSPSLSTLYRIAAVLDLHPSALLPSGPNGETKLVRAGHGARLAMSDEPHSPSARMLSRPGHTNLEAFEYEIDSAAELTEWFEHSGEEFLLVLSGALTIEVEPDAPITLRRGDSLHFDAKARHRWIAARHKPARIVLVVART
jgi:transcriptional regulator with XRE-family HTH domain